MGNASSVAAEALAVAAHVPPYMRQFGGIKYALAVVVSGEVGQRWGFGGMDVKQMMRII